MLRWRQSSGCVDYAGSALRCWGTGGASSLETRWLSAVSLANLVLLLVTGVRNSSCTSAVLLAVEQTSSNIVLDVWLVMGLHSEGVGGRGAGDEPLRNGATLLIGPLTVRKTSTRGIRNR